MTTPRRLTAQAHRDLRKQTLIAIALTCVAYGYYNIGDAALKMLAGKFHFTQIMITHCLIIIACTVASGLFRGGRKAFFMLHPRLVTARAVLSCLVSICNTLALPFIKLTTFYTLVFTSPFWVAVLATFFLKEKLDPIRTGVILVGFATIIWVFRPGGGLFDVHALLIVVGAFFYSCTLICMRQMGPKESRPMIIIMGCVVSIACAVVVVLLDVTLRKYIAFPWPAFYFTMPTAYQWGLFLMMGSLSAISVTCIAYAYANAPSASVIAPYHYTQIVWGALLGYYLFREVPDNRTMLGAAIIIAAGLYLLFTEARRKPKLEDLEPESAVAT
jgi:S-adenosylmethionine uptake transporter